MHLATIGQIVTELGRQYRRADHGAMEWQDARAAAAILREMRQALEGSALEQRLAAIEQALAERRGKPFKPNGRDSHGRPVGSRP
jgi:hypothetical protein